ncbi:unnamed protein product, partial [Onchocerca ochengi]
GLELEMLVVTKMHTAKSSMIESLADDDDDDDPLLFSSSSIANIIIDDGTRKNMNTDDGTQKFCTDSVHLLQGFPSPSTSSSSSSSSPSSSSSSTIVVEGHSEIPLKNCQNDDASTTSTIFHCSVGEFDLENLQNVIIL